MRLALLVMLLATQAAACMVELDDIEIGLSGLDAAHQEIGVHGYCHHLVSEELGAVDAQPRVRLGVIKLEYSLLERPSLDPDGLMRPPWG